MSKNERSLIEGVVVDVQSESQSCWSDRRRVMLVRENDGRVIRSTVPARLSSVREGDRVRFTASLLCQQRPDLVDAVYPRAVVVRESKRSTCPTRDDDVTCPECGIVYAPAWGHPDGTDCVLDPERAVAEQ